jgi:DnaK suppressor protein
MPAEERDSTQALAQAQARPTGPGGPHWRAVLEARWQALLRQVTELSLAYHAAAAGDAAGRGDAGHAQVRELLFATIAARRKLADVEEALGRLAAGTFGRCEQCRAGIPAGLLAASPDRRYCPRCVAEDSPAPALAGRSSG